MSPTEKFVQTFFDTTLVGHHQSGSLSMTS